MTVGAAEVRYGLFLNPLISFLAIALAEFLFVVMSMNAFGTQPQTA